MDTPAYVIGGLLSRFIRLKHKYGAELWILICGGLVVAAVVVMALFSGTIAPFDPHDQNAGAELSPPNRVNWMGTDNLGREVWSRIVHGAGVVLGVGLTAALFSSMVGITLGLVSGYWGGLGDRIASLVMDSLYSFPGLILAIAFAAMLGPGVVNITLAVAVIYIPTFFRMVRGQTISLKEELYVEAARAFGASRGVIVWKYIFPNIVSTTVVVFTLSVADAILIEAALTYLGLGLPPHLVDWGMDLAMGKKYLPSGVWWMITFPGAMISLLALGFTMIGEGLAEVINPRLHDR